MVSEKHKVRWALLSLSTIACTFVPDLILPRDASDPIEHEIVCISTTGGQERASSWLKDREVPNRDRVIVYDSWERMLQDGDFDIVYISTPHPLHYEEVLVALQRKRNVLVEKPATMNAEQYRCLTQAAKDNGVVLMEAMWTRYLPATQYLAQELLPRIGTVKRVFADFSFPIVSPDLEESSRFLDKQAGAGSLLDQGVYALTWVDIALNGLAPADTKVIHANSIGINTSKGDVDDLNTVVISKNGNEAKDSAIAIVTTSMTLTGSSNKPFYDRLQVKKPAPCVRIEGTDAQISIPFPPIRPEELYVQWYAPQYTDDKGREKEEVIKKPVHGWGLWYQADVIAKRVIERRSSEPAMGEVIGEEESVRVLAWMDEARKLAGIKYDPELDRV